MVIFSSLCYQNKNQAHHKNSWRNPKVHQLNAGSVYAQDSSICSHSKESSSNESFCLQLQVQWNQVEGKKIPNPFYLITNLAYWLKLHHGRNMYLWARLDTCADVNIMLASVYHLIFKDSEMKKIIPCKMQIGTYMADMVKMRILHILCHTSRWQEVNTSNILCGYQWWQHITIMQDHSCTPFNSTQIKIGLSSPMSQLNHKYNGSSKENKASIFESLQLQTSSVHSNSKKCKVKLQSQCLQIQCRNQVWTCYSQVKNKYYPVIQTFLKVSVDFQDIHTIYRLTHM